MTVYTNLHILPVRAENIPEELKSASAVGGVEGRGRQTRQGTVFG